jgi:uncharacterized protein YbjT (DUF2867 family)
MTELVTGATGYIGGRLVERLRGEGRPVRALARDPSRLPEREGVEPVAGDLLRPGTLGAALEGCSTAYYLVHSMERAGAANGDFAARDRQAAENFATAAADAGVERIVYLGGLVPRGGPRSPHLTSRLEVEEILLDAVPGSTSLRASIVIGARSSSFRILVRLVERLRVLPFPDWTQNRTRPIAERDAIEYLAATAHTAAAAGRSLDIGGPDVLSYAAMIEQIADSMGVGRTPLGVGASRARLTSAVVSAIVEQPIELVRPLMSSLEHDLLPRDDRAQEIYGLELLPYRRAVERALREWEQTEELSAR